MSELPQVEIGVFGGSGFYELLDDARPVTVETPFGTTSDEIMVGNIGGRSVAFMPRHGKSHSLPPHEINFRANIWTMKELGVQQIIGPNAAGSLQLDIHPGDFVVLDQFVDRTRGRKDTFFTAESGKPVTHISSADPYCPGMRDAAVAAGTHLELPLHKTGTVVVIQGPRFSTKAESEWFTKMGWSTVNMTQYPEAYLARELEMCYCGISLITDYDAGLGVHTAVTMDEALRVFAENIDKMKSLIYDMVPRLPEAADRLCDCPTATGGSEM